MEILGYFNKATCCVWTKCHADEEKTNPTVSAAAVKAKQNVRHGQRDASVGQGQMEHSTKLVDFNSQAHLGEGRFE